MMKNEKVNALNNAYELSMYNFKNDNDEFVCIANNKDDAINYLINFIQSECNVNATFEDIENDLIENYNYCYVDEYNTNEYEKIEGACWSDEDYEYQKERGNFESFIDWILNEIRTIKTKKRKESKRETKIVK